MTAILHSSYVLLMKQNRFELKSNGIVERVGPFGAYGPTVEAKTKSEAVAKFLGFAFRASENTPKVKIRNGAYQIAYENVNCGPTVEAGVEGREHSICFSSVKQWSDLSDNVASFDYYASDTYRYGNQPDDSTSLENSDETRLESASQD